MFVCLNMIADPIIKKGGWDPITQFIPPCVCAFPQENHTFPSVYNIVCFVFNYLRFEFCWYWWNCWPSLFKLSFQKKTFVIFSHYNIVACNSIRSNYQRGKGVPLIDLTLPHLLACSKTGSGFQRNMMWCYFISMS